MIRCNRSFNFAASHHCAFSRPLSVLYMHRLWTCVLLIDTNQPLQLGRLR